MTGEQWWRGTSLRAWLMLGFGLLALVATLIGVVEAVRAASDRSAYQGQAPTISTAQVTDVVVESGITRSSTYRLDVVDGDTVRRLEFPADNVVLAAAKTGSQVEVLSWRGHPVAVRWNEIRAETVDAPTVRIGGAVGVTLIGLGCAILGIGGWLIERSGAAHRPLVEATLVTAVLEGVVVMTIGWLLRWDPLRENTIGRFAPVVALVGTCLAFGVGIVLVRRDTRNRTRRVRVSG